MVIGLTVEYNPFHNGHLLQLKYLKSLYPNCKIILVMSGNFVQRGEPAIVDKYLRAEAAIKLGADIVFELPTVYATSPSANFAWGAVSLFEQLGIIDALAFGAENPDITHLYTIAKLIAEEPTGFGEIIRQNMKKGMSYPVARGQAIDAFLANCQCFGLQKPSELLMYPNNILAVDYLAAILRLNSKVIPLPLPRFKVFTDDGSDRKICSATYLREHVVHKEISNYRSFLPDEMEKGLYAFKENYGRLQCNDNFSKTLIYRLSCFEDTSEIQRYSDDKEGIINKIITLSKSCNKWHQIVNEITCKRYPRARINRLLWRILLDIEIDFFRDSFRQKAPYSRLLAVNRTQTNLLKKIKMTHSDNFSMLTKVSESNITKLQLGQFSLKTIKLDLRASKIYNFGSIEEKYQSEIMDYKPMLPKIID